MHQALEPLYTEGEPIEPYEWLGNHADDYDPEAQNAWGDLPMFVSSPLCFIFLFSIVFGILLSVHDGQSSCGKQSPGRQSHGGRAEAGKKAP